MAAKHVSSHQPLWIRHNGCKLGGIGPAAHDRGLDSWSGHSCVIWTHCLHPCTPVTKQSNLAKWRWCSVAGKWSAGLAKNNGSLPPVYGFGHLQANSPQAPAVNWGQLPNLDGCTEYGFTFTLIKTQEINLPTVVGFIRFIRRTLNGTRNNSEATVCP